MTYTPTLSISENEIMLRIDPGEGYSEVEFVWRKNHNYGFLKMYESDHTEFNEAVFLPQEAVRDLIAVMKYSLWLDEDKDDD